MSLTSFTMRGAFPGNVNDMKNQEQNYNSYVDDDESPIDLSKKPPAINRQKQSESFNEKQFQEEYIRGGDSPALSEDENERRYEFFQAIQKMSALAIPQLLHPWLMVNPKDLARVSGGVGAPSNSVHGGYGHQTYNAPNPYVLNPLSLASLYPLVSDQYGVRYGMVNCHNVGLAESAPSRLVDKKIWYCDPGIHDKDRKKPTEVKVSSLPETAGFRERRNYPPSSAEEDRNLRNRCASTPPDADSKSRRKILSIRHLRDSWKSDSKLLHSNKIAKSKNRPPFASDGSLDHAILRLHFAKKNKGSTNHAGRRSASHSSFANRRSHSCSDLSDFKQSSSNKVSKRDHCGYTSDNETFYNSPFSSSQCSLYSASSRKQSATDLRAYKRKSYAPSDESDIESDDKSLLSVGSESPPGKKLFHDATSLKGLRSLSEPSMRKNISPSTGDYSTPTDLSVKSSVPSEGNTFLRNHSPQIGMPWGVYGYYNHLLERFRDQEILKRHSSYSGHEHLQERYPVASEAGLSPPPSPSPENYSSLTSSGAWMDSSRPGDYGRDESPDSSALSSDPNSRKRPCRALTGKHVKHGTGASPSTLITLRQKIQERQKAKELGIPFDKGKGVVVKSKTDQNKKSHSSRSNSNKRERPKKFPPARGLQSKD